MPVFDTIRINQGHIAKVLEERQNRPDPTDDEVDEQPIKGFGRWMNYIRRELKKSNTISINIEYVMN